MEKNEKKLTNFDSEEWRVGPKAFISLAAAILFFSGIMTGFDGMKWLSAFDFSTLIGKFGTVKTLGKDTFVGTGGLGLRPLLGVPGLTGLALITDLQSTDAGAALTKELYDQDLITKKELTIIGSWQYSGAGLINNYFAIGSALFSYLTVPLLVPFLLMFVFKFVGAMFVRFVLNTVYKEDFKNE